MNYIGINELPPGIPTITQDNYALLRAMRRREAIEERTRKRKAFFSTVWRKLESVVRETVPPRTNRKMRQIKRRHPNLVRRRRKSLAAKPA